MRVPDEFRSVLHNICKNKKWGEICCEHDWIIKFACFLGIPWEKAPFGPKKASEKTKFSKKFHFFDIFLVLKHWVTLLKYKYQKKEKNSTEKCQKKDFSKFFSKKIVFLEQLSGIFYILS
jgi:hypothetical protein